MKAEDVMKHIFQQLNSYVKEPTDNYIYHYTSLEGLKSIMQNANLWFSDIDYLNDESEVKYGYKLVTDYLDENKSKYSKNFIRDLKKFCSSDSILYKKNKEKLQARYFVLSFSTVDDSLPMWNYYSKNQNFLGFSIQFKRKQLVEKIKKNLNHELFQGAVIYNKQEQQKYIKKIITDVYDLYSHNQSDDISNYTLPLCIGLFAFSLFIKNSCFMHEKEYRIVIPTFESDNRNVEFRICNNLLIPYISMKFAKSALTQVRLSPTQKSELIKSSLKDFSKKFGYKNIDVLPSDIPLRY